MGRWGLGDFFFVPGSPGAGEARSARVVSNWLADGLGLTLQPFLSIAGD
jgi:hypothetical protein